MVRLASRVVLSSWVFADGRYAIHRRIAGTWRAPVEPTTSPAILAGEAVNHLALVRRSGDLVAYVNGARLADARDLTALAGSLGVYASALHGGVEADFDNWRAYAATGGGAAPHARMSRRTAAR